MVWGKCIFISLVNRRGFLFGNKLNIFIEKCFITFCYCYVPILKPSKRMIKKQYVLMYYNRMYDYETEIEDKELKSVGLELMFMTPEKCSSENGITAVELAKLVEIPIEIVKKKLVILKEAGIVRVKGINPKYWSFDNYNFQRMDENDDVYRLLCNFDDVDFDRFFQY